jgi:hypothetical protein
MSARSIAIADEQDEDGSKCSVERLQSTDMDMVTRRSIHGFSNVLQQFASHAELGRVPRLFHIAPFERFRNPLIATRKHLDEFLPSPGQLTNFRAIGRRPLFHFSPNFRNEFRPFLFDFPNLICLYPLLHITGRDAGQPRAAAGCLTAVRTSAEPRAAAPAFLRTVEPAVAGSQGGSSRAWPCMPSADRGWFPRTTPR